jgi:type I restriction enzyme S subunit
VVHFDQCDYINVVAVARIRKGVGRRGDILLSHKGTVGKIARVGEDAPAFVCSPQTTFWRVLDPTTIDPGYLYAFMRSRLFASQLSSVQGETDMAPYVSLTAQRRLKIALPQTSIQAAIGDFLGALDDKIALNRRMAATLEQVARALFKSWFVDFDPVRAKAKCRPMGHPDDIAALFPDRFGDDGLPEGWQRKSLGDIVELSYGRALTSENRNEGDVAVFGSNGQVGRHNVALVRGPGVVIGRKGNPGTVTYVPSDFFCIDTTFYVVAKHSGLSMQWLWLALENLPLLALSADSAVPGLNRDAAYSLPVVLPTRSILAAFTRVSEAVLHRVELAQSHGAALSALRDALLPKLISGELRVADAEQQVSAA